jgi:hypothetical protein
MKKETSNHIHKSTLESEYEILLVSKFINYVVESLVIPIIRHCFYCTETSNNRNKIFYYQRGMWAKLRQHALLHLKSSLYSFIPEVKNHK